MKAPSAKDILFPSEEQFQRAKDIQIIKGEEDTRGQSRFASFIAAVENFQDVSAAYLKLRMKYADASHVVCAYRLPGANTPVNQDYIDDQEFGCGRTMLKALKERKLLNVAVFMVRYFGGKHIGPQRYDIFRELTLQAILRMIEERSKDGQIPTVPVPEHLAEPNNEWEVWSNNASKKSD